MKTRELDLRKLNSATKYPSILTYHALGDKGVLKDEVLVPFNGDVLYATEKVDGTNARILFMPDGMFIIGSREEFLYGSGDLIVNPAQHIVPTILETANRIAQYVPKGKLCVYYGEVYGNGVGASGKHYAKSLRGFRLFDAFALDVQEIEFVLNRQLEEISAWRENGGQPYVTVENLKLQAELLGLETVPALQVSPLPTGVFETHQWLGDNITKTLCALEPTALMQPEGIVVRTADRRKIAKIRYEDYERTLRKKK
jgi:hypothetical protein